MNKQVKSRQRVADHGEVFTAEREVKAMCDLVLPETQRIDSRFLEPACGDGNFLAEVLSRKLAVVRKKYRRSTIDYEMNSLLAVSSLYGVDILADNVAACRERLYKLWAKRISGLPMSTLRKYVDFPVIIETAYALSAYIIIATIIRSGCSSSKEHSAAIEPIDIPMM